MAATLPHPTVELTFDDGPDPTWTPRVLDALGRHDLRATFFVIAPRASAHPDLVARALAEGHDVQMHCHEHVRPDELREDGVDLDVRRALGELGALGISPVRWRPPWGIVTDAVRRVADRHGLVLAGWTADSADWRGDPASAGLAAVAGRLESGAIVLLHDAVGPGAPRTGCEATVELVGLLADELQTRGLRTSIPAAADLTGPTGELPRGGSAPITIREAA